MADKMSNEEIAAEFETLFGSGEEDSEETDTSSEEGASEDDSSESTDTSSEESEDETDDESSDENAEDEEDEESEEEAEPEKDKQKARQNYAFAEQRQQIKKQNDLIKGLGKLIGLENSSVDEIGDKLKEVLLEKESKEQNVSVDLLKRLERAEEILQENDRIKLEKNVTESFSKLIEKHGLDQDQVDEFTDYLISEGKNPMEDPNVDIHAEYLKLHWEDMLESAASQAVEKEQARKKKVSEKSSTKTPDGAGDSDDDTKVDSVKSLDDLFDKIDL